MVSSNFRVHQVAVAFVAACVGGSCADVREEQAVPGGSSASQGAAGDSSGPPGGGGGGEGAMTPTDGSASTGQESTGADEIKLDVTLQDDIPR